MWGIHALILDEMEQSVIPVDFSGARFSQQNIDAGKIPVPSYVCPSASIDQKCFPQKITTYRGNMGAWDDNDPNAILNNGIFFRNSGIQIRDILDGTSSTLLLGESLMGWWPDATSCCARIRDDVPDFDATWLGSANSGGQIRFFGFGSWHTEMSNFAFADGSAKAISKNIDGIVLRSLATRAGREPIAIEY